MYPQLSRVRKFWVTFMQKNRFGLWRFGSLKESAFSANAQSRFASALFDGVLGAVNLVRLTLRCPSISGSNARGESRALEGRPISLKCPSRIQDGNEGVAGRNWREKCFPNEGSLICPPGKLKIFHWMETDKNWVSVQTCWCGWSSCAWGRQGKMGAWPRSRHNFTEPVPDPPPLTSKK